MVIHPEIVALVDGHIEQFRQHLENAHQRIEYLPDDMTLSTVGDMTLAAMELYSVVHIMWTLMNES